MVVHPTTLRQLHASAQLPLAAVARFVLDETRARARALGNGLAAAGSSGLPLEPRAVDTVVAALAALDAAAAAAAAASSLAADYGSLSHAACALSSAVRVGVEAHRGLFVRLRETAGPALPPQPLLRAEALLTALQLNAVGLRVQAATLLARARGEPPPVRGFGFAGVVRATLEDVRAFAIEKFGAAPPVELSVCKPAATAAAQARAADDDVRVLYVPEYAAHAAMELLKNAFQAHVDRYGAAGLDDAPPVRLRVAGDARSASLRVSDAGGARGGWGCGAAPQPPPYFASSAVPVTESGWAYSRTHGAPFTGLGLGLVRAQLLAAYGGGGLAVLQQPGAGTDALLWLDRSGERSVDFRELL